MTAQLRVAILDDENHVRESTGILLARCCPDVEVVLSADPSCLSMDRIAAAHPDLILIDLTYNSQLGWTPIDLYHFLSVPVVIVTAHDPDTMQQMYPNLPYLLKPISSESLFDVVQQMKTTGTITHIEPS